MARLRANQVKYKITCPLLYGLGGECISRDVDEAKVGIQPEVNDELVDEAKLHSLEEYQKFGYIR